MAEKWWLENSDAASPLDAALQAEGAAGTLAALARSIYEQESGSGRNTRTSNAGAVGGMQITPSTFRQVADAGWDIDDPVQNARAGVRYAAEMLERGSGDPKLAAAGYYGGPGGQDKARRGVAVSDPRNPKAPNTLQYAEQVVGRLESEPQKRSQGGAWWLDYPEANESEQTPQRAATPTSAASMESSKPATSDGGSLGDELLRQAGLTVRHTVNGVAALPAMAADAVTGPINAGLDAVLGRGNGFRFQRAGASLDEVMTAAGLPKPKNATERVVGDVVAGVAGAGGMVGAGKVLSGAANKTAEAVGKLLGQGPGIQVASAAAGTGAAGATRESGGGAGAQVMAGLAGALAPSLVPAAGGAMVRGALRGADGKAVADRVAAFRGAGVEPTVGQATGGRVAGATESLIGKMPGGAGRMARFAQKQADDLAASVQALSDELAPGASAVNAGEAITRGINAFRDGVQAVQHRLYSTLDKYIPATTPIPVNNASRALAHLTEEIPNAPALSVMFRNAKIDGIHRAMIADLDKAAQTGQAAALPYESIKKLRTLVGKELSDKRLINDVPRASWARLYGALSDDLGEAAKRAGPDAEQAWSWANTFTRQQMQRLDELQSIVSRATPEKVFQAVVSGTAEGDTLAKRVISALPAGERREVAAAVLQRLGRAAPGQQNAAGDAFSSETFLTNLSKMSKDARHTLLGRTNLEGVLEKVRQFAAVADTRREAGRVFPNPSGTAAAGTQIAVGSGLAGGAVAAMTGHPGPLMGALAVPAAANLGARVMTSSGLVDMAAGPTTLAPGAQAAMLGAAARMAPDGLPYPQAEPVIGAPVDTRGTLERIGDAKTVDEAIKAIQPDDEPKKTTREKLAAERARAIAKRERIRAQNEHLAMVREQARKERIRLEILKMRGLAP